MPEQFEGESRYRVDEKDRVPVPPDYPALLGVVAKLARGDDGQIDVFPKPHFDSLLQKLAGNNSRAYRNKARFMRAAIECPVDKQFRLTIPEVLKEHAGILNDVIMVGNGDHFEMWNPDAWKTFYEAYVRHNAEIDDDREAFIAEIEA